MAVCVGKGADGEHCCWIDGKVCRFLIDGDLPRCGLLVELGSWEKVHSSRRWKRSKVGQWMKARHPGYGCGDWPQNIPEVMALKGSGIGLCCWEVADGGD